VLQLFFPFVKKFSMAHDTEMSSPRKFNRRNVLKSAVAATAGVPLLSGLVGQGVAHAKPVGGRGSGAIPTKAQWRELKKSVNGHLVRPKLPWGPNAKPAVFRKLKNPFWNEENPGAYMSTGYFTAWTAVASLYAVAATSAKEIATAVDFARKHDVRIAVKGTGHDYLGRNLAPDSLLIWTHNMRKIEVLDSFVPAGAPAGALGTGAITVGAGTRWLEAYEAATAAGRYVQGGGCTTVGACGGFTFGNGFGSFSKKFGTGSAGVLEIEMITADGKIRTVNKYQDPELFWAMKGGGGGTFGIASKVTLLTHPIPSTMGLLTGSIKANSDMAYRELIEAFLDFYPNALNNPQWGESIAFNAQNELGLRFTFLDLPLAQAQALWATFFEPLAARPADYEVNPEWDFLAFENLWNSAYWESTKPGFVTIDPRKDRPDNQFWWTGNQGELSVYWSSYQSRWIPLELVQNSTSDLAHAMYMASRKMGYIFQINKGLSGLDPAAVEREADTALHPGAYTAAALLIAGSSQQYKYPDTPGRKPNMAIAQEESELIYQGMSYILPLTPGAGTYLNETDYFLENWQEEQWGSKYPRLLAAKKRYDPKNIFRVHHGVGSELPSSSRT
jgi:hypothetical protein